MVCLNLSFKKVFILYFNNYIDEKQPWTDDAKSLFIANMSSSTELESVRFVGASGEEEN